MDKYVEANIVFSMFCKNYAELKKDLPVRPSEMGVLNIITRREGKFTPLMIAELLEVSKPMITAHITSLEKKGYIFREYSSDDKRSFYIIPTAKGRDLVETTAKEMGHNLKVIEEALGKEKFQELQEQLSNVNKVLKDLNENQKEKNDGY